MRYAIGLDIGGTKIAAGLVTEDGTVLHQETVASDPTDRETMFLQVIKCIDQLLETSSVPNQHIAGIGVGVPGKVDRKRGVAVFQNNLPWSQFPLVERLKEAFGFDRIVIDNDVHVAAFAEWKDKQLEDETFVYFTISTGISSAIIDGGTFMRGAGFAGEIGLVPVYTPGMTPEMTRLEQAVSGPALAKQANLLMNTSDMTGEKVFQLYDENDQQAKKVIDHFIDALAQGIYMINSLIDPDAIVFGGSVANYNPIIIDLLKKRLADYMIEQQTHLLNHLSISQLGKDQGVIGAAYQLFDDLNA